MIQWIAFTLSIIGIALNAKKNIWCWPVWIVSNGFWIYYSIQEGQFAALATWTVFLMFNFYGWYQWYTEQFQFDLNQLTDY